VSGAADPRQTGLWRDAVIAARDVIEHHLGSRLARGETDAIAEAVAERLLGDFLAEAEADSWIAFTPTGAGPVCTWCGRMAGPRLSPAHPQYGVFCACNRREQPPGPDGTEDSR
jgi:hypothetical protein